MKAGHLGLLLLVFAGCGPRPGPTDPDAASAREEASEPESEFVDTSASEPGADDSGTDGATSEPEAKAAEGDGSEPPVQDLAVVVACKRLCDRTEELCDAATTRKCRASCQDHVKQAVGCEDEVQTALRCQSKADAASLCADVASPNCVDQFAAMKQCKRGDKPKVATGPTLPSGWKHITDDVLGFTLALPPTAALDPDAKRRTWRAPDGSIEYFAAQLSTPGEPITSKVLLRLVLEFVGTRCQKNLKLHGQFEIGDEVAILFDATCSDGLEWHGMLRARPDQALATAFHAAPNSGGVMGPFFYSYKRLPR